MPWREVCNKQGWGIEGMKWEREEREREREREWVRDRGREGRKTERKRERERDGERERAYGLHIFPATNIIYIQHLKILQELRVLRPGPPLLHWQSSESNEIWSRTSSGSVLMPGKAGKHSTSDDSTKAFNICSNTILSLVAYNKACNYISLNTL